MVISTSLVWTIIIGIAAGFIAGKIMRGRGFGLLINLVVGVIGSYAGGFIYEQLGLRAEGFAGLLIMSTVGAVIFLAILRVFR